MPGHPTPTLTARPPALHAPDLQLQASQQAVTVKPASPLRVTLLTAVLILSSSTFLTFSWLHAGGQLGFHTEAGAGLGLLVLGLITLLPGLYGAYLIWLVALGQETWESIPF